MYWFYNDVLFYFFNSVYTIVGKRIAQILNFMGMVSDKNLVIVGTLWRLFSKFSFIKILHEKNCTKKIETILQNNGFNQGFMFYY